MTQRDWRYCGKCSALFYDGYPDKGPCLGGGTHQASGLNFTLPYALAPDANSQAGWGFCNKCHCMFYNAVAGTKAVCSAGGPHDGNGSLNFVLPHDLPGNATQQADWRFCGKCWSMFFNGAPTQGLCPGGGAHIAAGLNFCLPHDPQGPFWITPSIATGDIGAQNEWRFCGQCCTLFFNGGDKGACPIGGPHSPMGFNYFLPIGSEDLPHAQADWRFCGKCASLFFYGDTTNAGACPRGGAHDAGASLHFVLPTGVPELANAQSGWCFCGKCRSLFFNGLEMKGSCPASGSHVASGLTFVLPHDINQPIVKTTLFESQGAAAFALTANVAFNLDGSIRYYGEARNSGIDGYDYSAAVVVRSPFGNAVAMSHSGHVDPHPVLVSGTHHDYWDVTYPSASSLFFTEMLWGDLQRNVKYTGWFTDVINDVLSWVISFEVGELLGPIGAIAFLGAELIGIVTGTVSATSRIIGGTLWLAGPYNMLFALAGEGIANIGHNERQILPEEYDWANKELFHGSLPPIERLWLTDTIGGGGRAFTFPSTGDRIYLNLGTACYADPMHYDNPQHPNKPGHTLLHELVHASQLFHNLSRIGYITQGLAARVCEATGTDPYKYAQPGQPYSSYHLEQQAQVVEDWWTGQNSPNGTDKDPANPYYRYVLDMQTGNF